MNYLRLLRQKAYIGLLIVLLCACAGSIRGAAKEYKEAPYDITEADMAAMGQPEGTAPDLVGVIPLAAEQNRWYNFSYAAHYAGRGFVIYCVVMAVYLPLYRFPMFAALRAFLKEEEGCRLFIKAEESNPLSPRSRSLRT